MNQTLLKAIKQLPKIELHVHLDGSVKPETLIKLAKQQNKPLPTYDAQQLLAYMQVEEKCESLNEYLSTFAFVLPFLQTTEALEQTAFELVEQCAEQNVKYVEVRFAPHLHIHEGLSVEQIYEAVIAGLKRGEQQYNVIARCIGIILRGHEETNQHETVEIAFKYLNKGLVAVDLAGAEALFPPSLYEAPFSKAKSLHIPITIHGGEAGGADNVWTSVTKLHATRIGHGVRLAEDEKIFNDIKEMQIPLEFCPISNIQTKAVADWSSYPIVEYMEKGIKITVNTDNLTVSNTNLTKELVTLVDKFDLSLATLVSLQLNALDSIFLEQPAKDEFEQSFKQVLQKWQENYNN